MVRYRFASLGLLVLSLFLAWCSRQLATRRAFLEFAIEHNLILYDRFTGLIGYNFSDFCRQNWDLARQDFSNQTLLIFENKSFTYREIDEYAHKLAVVLRERGAVKPGDVVVSALELRPEGLVVLLACTLLGAIHAPVSPFLSKQEVASARTTLGEASIVVVAGGAAEDHWRAAQTNIFAFDLEGSDFQGAAATRVVPYKWALHETMVLISTSGTTGTPKFVETAARSFTGFSKHSCRSSKNRILLTAGWEANTVIMMMHKALRRGASFVLSVDHASRVCTPDAARIWLDLMLKHQVQVFVMYPPMSLAFREINNMNNTTIPSMRIVILSGQAPNREACKAIQPLFPKAIWTHAYSLTEAMSTGVIANAWHTSVSGSFPNNFFESVGRWPGSTQSNRLHAYKLVHDPLFPSEKGNPVGEIRLLSLMHQFKGYWRNPKLTAQAFDEDGYLRTNDLAYVDEGFVYLAGRVDDVIKHTVTGKQIYPRVVEEALESHPNVSLVGVVPKRGKVGTGDQVVACIVAKGHVTKAALMEHVSTRLADFQQPSEVYFLESLPLTRNSKVARKVLKNMVADFA